MKQVEDDSLTDLKPEDIEILGWKGIVPHLTCRIYYEVEKPKQKKEAEQLKKQILEWEEFYNSSHMEMDEEDYLTEEEIEELKKKAEKWDKFIEDVETRE